MVKLNSKGKNILKNIFIKYMEIGHKKMLEDNQLIGNNPKIIQIKRNKKYVWEEHIFYLKIGKKLMGHLLMINMINKADIDSFRMILIAISAMSWAWGLLREKLFQFQRM